MSLLIFFGKVKQGWINWRFQRAIDNAWFNLKHDAEVAAYCREVRKS